MNKNLNFHMVGYGYLHDINFNGKKPLLRIQKFQTLMGTKEREEIWFYCTFPSMLKEHLEKLDKIIAASHTVLLHFCLDYKGFGMCYQGQAFDDAAQIVIFHAELQEIYEVFVNGTKLFDKSIKAA